MKINSGSCNGLVLNIQQAIPWTNYDSVLQSYVVSFGVVC